MFPTEKSYVLESANGRYFKDIKFMFEEGKVIETIIRTTDNIKLAKIYDDFRKASVDALSYNLNIVTLHVYQKEV
ncbi:hypothetical protein H7866_05240 [Staphylococcus hominis]|uniref:hypothetical protein n=1 Tax=Staphylococcus hominis TaxID=1290 RepID=UPI001642B33B|nr:hypothetical protein [Staphylococcus hominis]MBC3067118.1 hypothetical protein [Staphylococcus hominis]MBC3073595.1 hypothetical protein [Staphylococcus hominis]